MTLDDIDKATAAIRGRLENCVQWLAMDANKAAVFAAGQLDGYWKDLEVLRKIRSEADKWVQS